MKNTLKFLGIITFVVIIGFSITACGDESGNGDAIVKVINNYNKPITKVEISPRGTEGEIISNDEIASGNSKTFNVKLHTNITYAESNFILSAEGVKFSDGFMGALANEGEAFANIKVEKGKTVTVTLTSEGKLTIN